MSKKNDKKLAKKAEKKENKKKDVVLYNYHPETGEKLKKTVARRDPRDGLPLIPAHSTTEKPPKVGDKEVAVFVDGKWSVKTDLRGEEFYDKKNVKQMIRHFDEFPDKEWSKDKTPPDDEEIMRGIKSQASQRIIESGHDWMAIRQITTDIAVPQDVLLYAENIRDTSTLMEEDLPEDFFDDKHWPERLS